jgi:hypothetical protein
MEPAAVPPGEAGRLSRNGNAPRAAPRAFEATGESGALAVGKIESKGRQNRRGNVALAD